MLTERTAHRLASTGRLSDVSIERSLNDVATLAIRGVPGCAAAVVVVWDGPDVRTIAATHPDVARLVELQCHYGEGPVVEARRTQDSIFVADTLQGEPWPRYAAAAVRVGVRSLVALPLEVHGSLITFSLHSARPRVWEKRDVLPMASLFAAQVAVILRNLDEYEPALDNAQTGGD